MCATCAEWEQEIVQDVEKMKPHVREAGVMLLMEQQ